MSMNKQPWYTIKSSVNARNSRVEIRIHDEIGAGGITSETFIKDLERLVPGGKDFVLSINSPGGDVFAANAIYNELTRYKGKITGRVEGIAASAASLILMAADRIVMPENAMIMIHNPWTVTGGEAKDLRNLADMMDEQRKNFVKAYAKRSGQPAAEIERMMDETTWMGADEAMRLGFCDEVEDPIRLVASTDAIAMLAKHKSIPDDLIASMRRGAQRQQKDSVVDTAQAVEEYVRAECRTRNLSHLTDALLLKASNGSRDVARRHIEFASDVQGLCVAAHFPKLRAVEFVKSGLDLESIRERIFDEIVSASDADIISNKHSSNEGLSEADKLPKDVYERRRQLHTAQHSNHSD
ncbi:hypothetical protein CAL21_20535 [Bordetella genomosp. 4]|nr:hypothetical protein CAL21_20535 [Bordetella genomosp. 4]